MPNDPAAELSELFERMRLMETAISSHVAECGVRNKNRERWEESTEHQIKVLSKGIHSLNLSRAKMIGYIAGAAAGGSILGTAALEAAVSLFSQ